MKLYFIAFILAFGVFALAGDAVSTQATTETVTVAEPAAPPEWAEKLIVEIVKLPVIGPIVAKTLLYLGIIGAITTALIAFLLTTINALSGILNISGLNKFAEQLQLFKNSKIMYWLKYISLFNAKKPEKSMYETKLS